MSILILTVFLSLSAPAYAAETDPGSTYGYVIYGYVNYTNGTPADGELVTIYKEGYPLENITAEVGLSYGVSGWWKVSLYNIGNVANGDTIVFEVLGKSTSLVVNTAMGGRRISNMAPTTSDDDDDTGSSSGDDTGSSGGGGTYPPNWGEPAPTAAATSAPTAAAPEPTTREPVQRVTQVETPTVTHTTETPTETSTTTVQTNPTPGFGAVSTVFAIAGLLAAVYLVMRRRE